MKIGIKQRQAIEMLIEGRLPKYRIAEELGVSERTFYNWLNDEEFQAEYSKAEDDLIDRQRRRILAMSNAALARQEQILKKSRNDNAAASVAADVLDRAGFDKKSTVNIKGDERVVIVDDVGDVKQ